MKMDIFVFYGAILLAAISTSLWWIGRSALAKRANIPDVAWFLATGILTHIALRSAGVHIALWIRPLAAPSPMTIAASFVILWGAAELSPQTLRVVAGPIAALASVGVITSALALGVAVWALHLTQLSLFAALLLGAVLAGTDPTVLVSILDQVPLSERIREVLIAESALNDPISAILAVFFLPFVIGGAAVHPLWPAIGLQVWQTVTACGAGLTAAVTVRMLSRTRPPALRLIAHRTEVRFLLLFCVAFALAQATSANPFLSSFVAGLAGQPFARTAAPLPDSSRHRSAAVLNIISFYVRAYIFLLLGLTIPTALHGEPLIPALIAAGLLIVAARPASVLAAWLFYRRRLTRHETLFLCLNRQTGVMPALLINILAADRLPEADFFRLTAACAIALTSGLLLPLFRPLASRLELLVATPVCNKPENTG